MEKYFKSINSIVSRIRIKQSSRSAEDKTQSWANLCEEIKILERKYKTNKSDKETLRTFDPETSSSKPTTTDFNDYCSELQYNLVESTREFHLQVYNVSSSLMKFIETAIAEKHRRGISTGSVAKFYNDVFENPDLQSDIEVLRRSYDFRVFITHPVKFKNFDWVTVCSTVIYYHFSESKPDKDKQKILKQTLKKEGFPSSLFPLNADDFVFVPDVDATFKSLLRVIKNQIRKFADT